MQSYCEEESFELCRLLILLIRVYVRSDLADRKDVLIDRNYFVRIPRWLQSKILVYFDSGNKGSFHSILFERLLEKISETVLVAQITLKHCSW